MKILFLNGSPRQNGFTAKILKEMKDGVAQGHEVEWIDVNTLSMKPCVGCLRCRPDQECALPKDDAHMVGEKIRIADVLIIGSPTYWGNMTGPLKILFDRNVPVFEYIASGSIPKPCQKGKKAILVTTSNAPWPINLLPTQSKGAIRALKTVAQNGGYKIIGIINLAGAGFKKELPINLLKQAKKMASRL